MAENETNGFAEYRRLILSNMERLESEYNCLNDELTDVRLRVRELETRFRSQAGIIAVIVSVATAIVVRLVSAFLG